MAARFLPNPTLEQELKLSPLVEAKMNARAEAALRVAQSLAAGFAKTGAYASSFDVDGNRLFNTDPGAIAQELGAPSKNTPARAPLRKAAISVGAVVMGGDSD